MDLQAFGDPWEHVRLLSDRRRTEALIALLARRAPGATVLEIGCGSGLLSCLAARLGAARVIALEPTDRAEAAQLLVERNGLGDVVEVIPDRIQDVDPRPVDLAFSELLNADPFAEDVLDAMDAAARWLRPGGTLSPRRLRVWVGLVRDDASAVEVREVRALLGRLARGHDLDLSPMLEDLDGLEPYRYFAPRIEVVTTPVCVADLPLGTGQRPVPHQRLRLPVAEPGPVGGATVWFEAELDDDLSLDNAPGHPGHWGHLVLGWPVGVQGAAGGEIEVEVSIDDEEITVTPGGP